MYRTWSGPRRRVSLHSTGPGRPIWIRLRRLLQDKLSRSFTNHHDSTCDKSARYFREYGGVRYSQSLGPVDPKRTVYHASSILRPNGTRAGRMMTPCVVADELRQFLFGLDAGSGQQFL